MKRLLAAYLAPVPAARLGVFRVLVSGFALAYLLMRAPAFLGLARLPAHRFAPVGVLASLDAPLPGAAVVGLWAAAVGLSAAVVLGRGGWPVRAAFAAALLSVLTYRNSWGMVFHTENLLAIHALALGLAPEAGPPLQALLRGKGSGRPIPGWPLRVAAAATAIAYFLAGVAKLRWSGLDWLFDETLRNYVAYDNVRKLELGDRHAPLGAWLLAAPWVFRPLAALTLAFELAFPLALAARPLARILCATAWSFHLGVLLTMAIFFPYPLVGVAFAPFFDLERIPERLRRAGLARSRRVRGTNGANTAFSSTP